MKMTMRWFGKEVDTVPLSHIRQVPGVTGVITTLYGSQPGEVWSPEDIKEMIDTVEAAGLTVDGIESVNIHDSIKVGTPDREQYIDNYIETLENLGKQGIHMVCYNFMPVFDWTRSDLAKKRPDGSTVLSYDQSIIDDISPDNMFQQMDSGSGGFELPGWEPERMKEIQRLFELYQDIDQQALFDNLVYFLERILPTCETYEIYMAIHPDDPAWPVFDLPRIVTNQEQIQELMKAVDSPYNGVTLCTGSLGSHPDNDIPAIIRSLPGRIHFAHLRNLKHIAPGKFDEAAHLSSDGSLDMFEIMKALYDIGFDGPLRPDHGRMIWDEVAMPGYGLYDRALGIAYLNGILESLEKCQH